MKRRLWLMLGMLVAGVTTSVAAEPATATTVDGAPESPVRPVTSSYMLGVGVSSLTDTYLSPVTYSGFQGTLLYERWQAMRFAPRQWMMRLYGAATLADVRNSVGNAREWDASLSLGWAMMRKYHPVDRLTLAPGGAVALDAGVLYNGRNSNNPVSARAALTLGFAPAVAYDVNIGRLPVTLSFRALLPVFGVFFMPDYDELYYEIYLGNHSGIIKPAWFFNRFSLTDELYADLHLGATQLRIGYRGTFLTARANNNVRNIFTNAFVIGITIDRMSLRNGGVSESTRQIINALQ